MDKKEKKNLPRMPLGTHCASCLISHSGMGGDGMSFFIKKADREFGIGV